ncbi:unnamed protein product [Fraxinus pennsylvanica]|uniref:Sulfotransferase n=1 Tax=Fraxinus pennsylvanica TaxID=56036 RepID=A0AAD2ACX2_9LAMI|nr:unnamed protein product [Fraxinus pennsylvanica]
MVGGASHDGGSTAVAFVLVAYWFFTLDSEACGGCFDQMSVDGSCGSGDVIDDKDKVVNVKYQLGLVSSLSEESARNGDYGYEWDYMVEGNHVHFNEPEEISSQRSEQNWTLLGSSNRSKKHSERIFFLKYEDMKEKHVVHLRCLAEFSECPFSVDEEETGLLEEILKLCIFDNLNNLEINKTDKLAYGMQNKTSFGDWKNHLTAEMVNELDQITEHKFSEREKRARKEKTQGALPVQNPQWLLSKTLEATPVWGKCYSPFPNSVWRVCCNPSPSPSPSPPPSEATESPAHRFETFQLLDVRSSKQSTITQISTSQVLASKAHEEHELTALASDFRAKEEHNLTGFQFLIEESINLLIWASA